MHKIFHPGKFNCIVTIMVYICLTLQNTFAQGNGQAKSTNKNLVNITKKLVDEKGRDWHKRLYEAVWADRTSPKRAIGMTPFEFIYGVEAQLSLPLELVTLNLQKSIEDEVFQSSIEKRILYLQRIEEERRELVDHITHHQARVKRIFDQKERPWRFMKGDQVLLWDKRREPRGAHSKF